MKELSVNDIIEDWAEDECVIHCDSIKHRLLDLIEWSSEDDENDPMREASLIDALEFLNSRPSLTLCPNGYVSASWQIFDHKLVIRFRGCEETQALLLKIY